MRVISVLDIRELIRQFRAEQPTAAAAQAVGAARNTAARYRRWAKKQGWLDKNRAMPSEEEVAQAMEQIRVAAPQTVSRLDPYHEAIQTWREQGLNISAVRERLKQPPQGITCSYSALWSYVQKLEGPREEAVMRMETSPGEEAQVDFGYARRMYDPLTQKDRKTWAFVMVLSWSRHMYVEFVFDQRVATWVECHRHAFEYFGGVPERVVLDNLKSGVLVARMDDSDFERNYRACAEHYGFLLSPCRVQTPQHKGKVEAGVKYVKGNFLPGRVFNTPQQDIRAANRAVRLWLSQTAGQRTHGTTHQKPLERFESVERAVLKPLPDQPYEVVTWKEVKLHCDSHVVFDGAFYSAPCRLIGQKLNIRGSRQDIEIHHEYSVMARHARVLPGQRSTQTSHLPEYKLKGIPPTRSECLRQAAAIGTATAEVIGQLIADPVIDKRRTAQRVLELATKHGSTTLEQSCRDAIDSGDPSPMTVRNFVKIHLGGVQFDTPTGPVPFYARSAAELIPAIAVPEGVSCQ